MEKTPLLSGDTPQRQRKASSPSACRMTLPLVLTAAFCTLILRLGTSDFLSEPQSHKHSSIYGKFPKPDDPFRFLPCTAETVPPPLEDKHHAKTWAALFDPNENDWSWGNTTSMTGAKDHNDPHASQGIYLCGYLDVPLDYQNASESRFVRLAVNKYQVSGLARKDGKSPKHAGKKSSRTLIMEPGGPGGSGTSFVWRKGEFSSQRLSEGTMDAFGWDPRGVNLSLPAISCFPHDADRDRWALIKNQYRHASATSPRGQLELADAMNDATFAACKEVMGDLPRFVSTTSVARDLDQIRAALGEDEVSGYFVSYGTGIGQTYANMFPDHVGQLILDGTEYVRDHRELGGFGWTALDNATDAYRDGFIGECIAAGPKHCALAQPQEKNGNVVTVSELEDRLSSLFSSLADRPRIAYLPSSGPSLVTYSSLIAILYQTLYDATSWPAMAQGLYDLEQGNSTLIAGMLDRAAWEFTPPTTCPAGKLQKPSTEELGSLVICADSYDAPLPPFNGEDTDGLTWFSDLWKNMSSKAFISGDSRFYDILPCRHYTKYFGSASEVYRGDLNNTLSNPILLIAETYDPATPLRNGRRLLNEMGKNARLIAHHGYGHSSRDVSACTDRIARDYIMYGKIPEDQETACYADGKPYLYDASATSATSSEQVDREALLTAWTNAMRGIDADFKAGRAHRM